MGCKLDRNSRELINLVWQHKLEVIIVSTEGFAKCLQAELSRMIFKGELWNKTCWKKRDQFSAKEIIIAWDDPAEIDPYDTMPNASFSFHLFFD